MLETAARPVPLCHHGKPRAVPRTWRRGIRLRKGALLVVAGLVLAGCAADEAGDAGTRGGAASSERRIETLVHDQIIAHYPEYQAYKNSMGAALSACIAWGPRPGVLYEVKGLYTTYVDVASDVTIFPSRLRRDALARCRASPDANQGVCRCYEIDVSGQNVLRLDDDARRRIAAAGEVSERATEAHAGMEEVAGLRRKGDMAGAMARVEAALKVDPDDSAALTWRGILRRDAAGGQREALTQAIADFDRAIASDPGNEAAFSWRGQVHYDLDAYEAAIADFSEASRLDPQWAHPLLLRGRSHAELKRYRRAIEDYDRAIRLDPASAGAYRSRGLAYRNLDDLHKALADYSRAIELDPDQAASYSGRGVVLRQLGAYDRAIRDYDKALSLAPDTPRYLNNRGYARYRSKDHAAAIADFDRAIALSPDYSTAYRNRAVALAASGQPEKALADSQHALTLAPGNAGALADHAIVLFYAGRATEALARVEEALRMDPERRWVIEVHAQLLAAAGRPDAAVAEFERAMAKSLEGDIRDYQKALAAEGYYRGPVNGRYGPELRDAMRACFAAGCTLLW